jgi:tRNA(fMet)-specific endonuclease VapC
MKYLLDANAIIALLKSHQGVLTKIKQSLPNDIAIPSVVAHELYYGAYKSQRIAANLAILDQLQFETLDFDRQDAAKAGEIRATLATAGTPIGPYDVLIAGQALNRNLTLVTRNVGEFGRIPALRIENWEAEVHSSK